MNNSPITIGQFHFKDFEVPSSIRFGGRQRLVVHRLSDGTRAIEPLGPDDSQIRFEGAFSGVEAESRARALDNLRIAGSRVWLTWHSFRYYVIISDFSATYHSRWWISYRIGLVVINQSGVVTSGIDMQRFVISGALSAATAAAVGSPIDLTSLSSALAVDNALVAGTTAHSQAALAAGQSMQAVQNQVDQRSVILDSLNHDPTDPLDATSSFAAQLNCTASLAGAVNARSYVGRIVSSLKSPAGSYEDNHSTKR